MTKLRTALILMLLLGAPATPALAQAQPAPAGDSLFAALFPPELIMQHRRAIDLSDAQRDGISRLIAQLQGQAVTLQWELLDEMEQLQSILGAQRVDMDRALDQMESVLDLEKQIKTAHLEMLVRIKNLLRPEQQEELRRLRTALP